MVQLSSETVIHNYYTISYLFTMLILLTMSKFWATNVSSFCLELTNWFKSYHEYYNLRKFDTSWKLNSNFLNLITLSPTKGHSLLHVVRVESTLLQSKMVYHNYYNFVQQFKTIATFITLLPKLLTMCLSENEMKMLFEVYLYSNCWII